MQLYNYFRSSASFRVRIALQLKGLPYDYMPVHLVKGEHKSPDYAGRIGDALVPTLVTDGGTALSQSMAIIEYLDETHPTPALLPTTPLAREGNRMEPPVSVPIEAKHRPAAVATPDPLDEIPGHRLRSHGFSGTSKAGL